MRKKQDSKDQKLAEQVQRTVERLWEQDRYPTREQIIATFPETKRVAVMQLLGMIDAGDYYDMIRIPVEGISIYASRPYLVLNKDGLIARLQSFPDDFHIEMKKPSFHSIRFAIIEYLQKKI